MDKQTPQQQQPARRWAATFHEGGGYDCLTDAWRIADEAGQTIAEVDLAHYGQPFSGACPSEANKQAMANALLIAAAPGLLAALGRCLAELEGIARDGAVEVDGARIDAARTAIAKAKGGA